MTEVQIETDTQKLQIQLNQLELEIAGVKAKVNACRIEVFNAEVRSCYPQEKNDDARRQRRIADTLLEMKDLQEAEDELESLRSQYRCAAWNVAFATGNFGFIQWVANI